MGHVAVSVPSGEIQGPPPSIRRRVQLIAGSGELSVAPGQEIEPAARVSADTKAVRYFLDWHFLQAASLRDRFRLEERIDFPPGVYLLTAVAVDDRGLVSLPSEAAQVRLRVADEPPAPPVQLEGDPGDGRAYLHWRPAPRASSYRVKRSEQVTGPYTLIGITTSCSYVDHRLENGRTYYYVTSAVNPYGESADSAPAAVTPQAVKRRSPRSGSRGG